MLRQATLAMSCAAGLCAAGATTALAADPIEHVSCKGEANEIRVTVKNVRKGVGLMTGELFRNDSEGFLNKKGRLFRVRYAAHAPMTQFCLKAPDAGKWAVAVYHDQNANQKLDKGAFGIPSEPYGVSGNPKMRFGPPAIEEALVEVGESGADIEIDLRG